MAYSKYGRGTVEAEIEAAEREIVRNRETEWWERNRQKYLDAHPEACASWLRRHRSTADMPCPPAIAPDLSPKDGFVVIRAASGRGFFVIAADAFAGMPKRAQKKLMDYANK